MPSIIRSSSLLAVVALSLALPACTTKSSAPATRPAAVAGAPKAAAPATKLVAATLSVTEEWFDLFDGKTLKNWKMADFAGGGEPIAKDGNIVIPLPAGGDMSGLFWAGIPLPKANYEISLQTQRTDGGDFFCGLTFPVNDSHATLVLGGWGGGVCGISCLDFEDASRNDSSSSREFKNKTWYSVRMRVFKDRLQAWVGDDRIVNVSLKDRKVNVRIECEACRPVGLATWNTAAAVRDFRIRLLRADELEAAAEEAKRENP